MEQLSFNQNLAYANGHPQSLDESCLSGQAVLSTVNVSSPKPSPATGNVTEIILPEGQVENFQLLLPMLTQLNQEKRWLAWIDPPQSLVSKWQKMRGIVAGELLVLRSTPEHPAGELAERALSAGTCHAVIMWTKSWVASLYQRWNRHQREETATEWFCASANTRSAEFSQCRV